ncbi:MULTISPECIES: ArsR/SmtB family transcription factor [unclassified Pseudomonas]|uniref:ArsR/SmtB family transcription factor n=1 Tax=unclassified Pseudomonas TaxID=196821 RepID=UPI0035C249A8
MSELLPQPTRAEITLDGIFRALAEPLRRTAIAVLATMPDGTERSCASFGFPVAKASLTHHFKVLREVGLISQIDYGNRRASILRREDIDERFPGLLQLLVNELNEQYVSDKP